MLSKIESINYGALIIDAKCVCSLPAFVRVFQRRLRPDDDQRTTSLVRHIRRVYS